MTNNNYMQVGRQIACGHCHPEKFEDCKKLREKYPDLEPCNCVCHASQEQGMKKCAKAGVYDPTCPACCKANEVEPEVPDTLNFDLFCPSLAEMIEKKGFSGTKDAFKHFLQEALAENDKKWRQIIKDNWNNPNCAEAIAEERKRVREEINKDIEERKEFNSKAGYGYSLDYEEYVDIIHKNLK